MNANVLVALRRQFVRAHYIHEREREQERESEREWPFSASICHTGAGIA